MAAPQRKHQQQDMFGSSGQSNSGAEVIAMPVDSQPNFERSNNKIPLRVGEILKRERERRGYDLQQIADYLCIRRSLLVALEESRYDAFQADAYIIGFLRSYADIIGLNGAECINLYRQEMAGRRKKPDLVMPTPVMEGRAPTAVIMGAAAVASLLIYVLWYGFSASDRATVTKPQSLPTTAAPLLPAQSNAEALPSSAPSGIAISGPAPTASAPSAAAAAPSPVSEPVDNKHTEPVPAVASSSATVPTSAGGHIVIKADQSSWILIADSNGQTIYDHVLKPGDIYKVPNQPGLTLTTGNGAGVIVSLDGVDMPRLSKTTSHIVRNISLDAASLKALPPQPAQ
jgi:cytoskeleton protein RodZ